MSVPRSTDIVRVDGLVTQADRRRVHGHGPATVWFTGLSGAGKSTLAFAAERALTDRGIAAYVLDGDNVRFGLNRDLGFSPADRTENIRRIGEVCRLMHDAGLIVLTAFISPYLADRQQVRELHPAGNFYEVHVATALHVCEQRDVKGLYAKARTGQTPHFSGVSAPYEPPMAPELRLDTAELAVEGAVARILQRLQRDGVIPD
jgi:adenylyl-sulfate kinase